MEKKKILYVITQGEWGGAQRYIFDLATNLNSIFDITVAVGELKGKKDLQNKLQVKGYGIRVIELHHLVRAISPIHDMLAILELRKIYKSLKPDIIHLNSSKAGIIGSLAKWYMLRDKCYVIYTVHGWVFNEPTRKWGRILYRFLEKATTKLKNKIIVLSDRDLNDGIKLGISETKLVKIPLAIEPPQFLTREVAQESLSKISNFKFQISNFVIGTIANLYPSKGIDILIEAVKIINMQSAVKNLHFVIIGEGPERSKLEDLIKKYNFENIIFLTGTLDTASKYLKAFDLFVLPSRKEGSPYTILEASAANLPIVATNVGGIKESVIDAVTPEEPKMLAEKIIEKMGSPIPIKESIPSLEEMLKQTEKIYLNYPLLHQ